MRLTLCVRYTEDYPDRVPEMTLQVVEGKVDVQELQTLLLELRTVVCRRMYRSSYLTKIGPSLGKRKYRNGYDIHPCLAPSRTIVTFCPGKG